MVILESMSTELGIAFVGGLFGLLSIIITGCREYRNVKSTRKYQEKQEEKNNLKKTLQVMNQYRDPLIYASLDLKKKIDSVLQQRRNSYETKEAKLSFIYLIGQFLCWREIIRKKLLFFDMGNKKTNKKIRCALENIYDEFETLNYSNDLQFHLTYVEQRAIGEIMEKINENKTSACIGYAEFVQKYEYEQNFQKWFMTLINSIDQLETYFTSINPQYQRKLDNIKNIENSNYHYWEENPRRPGICATCGLHKDEPPHDEEASAHFYRLARLRNKLKDLMIVLDTDGTRVSFPKKIKKKEKSCWKKIKCCKKRQYQTYSLEASAFTTNNTSKRFYETNRKSSFYKKGRTPLFTIYVKSFDRPFKTILKSPQIGKTRQCRTVSYDEVYRSSPYKPYVPNTRNVNLSADTNRIELMVMSKYTVSKIKKMINQYDNSFKIYKQKLYYLGKELNNFSDLQENNIGPDSTINIVLDEDEYESGDETSDSESNVTVITSNSLDETIDKPSSKPKILSIKDKSESEEIEMKTIKDKSDSNASINAVRSDSNKTVEIINFRHNSMHSDDSILDSLRSDSDSDSDNDDNHKNNTKNDKLEEVTIDIIEDESKKKNKKNDGCLIM